MPEVERVVRWPEYRSMALAAEEVGFDSIWLGDHLLYRDEGEPERGPGCRTLLASIAALTERVELGPLVACLAFHPPGLIAAWRRRSTRSAAGGSCSVSARAGTSRSTAPSAAVRSPRVALPRGLRDHPGLLAGEHVTLDGTYWQAEDAVLLPPPARTIPIMLGTSGPRQLAATLPHAHSWNSWWDAYGNTPEGFATTNAGITAIARGGGCDPASVERSACALVSLDPAERPAARRGAADLGQRRAIARHLHDLAEAGAHEAILVLDPIDEPSIRKCGAVLAALDA